MIYNGLQTNDELKKRIKKLSVETEITITDICKKLNIMPQSYQNIFKKQKLAFSDIANILDCLGYELEINFIPKK